MKKYLIFGLLTLFVIAGGIFVFSAKDAPPAANTPLPSAYEYFWGDGCPHCTQVAEFLDGWEGKDKVAIEKKEVWNNRTNLKLMQERATYCGLNKNKIGVPFVFTPEGKCIIGDEPIIQLFKNLEINN